MSDTHLLVSLDWKGLKAKHLKSLQVVQSV